MILFIYSFPFLYWISMILSEGSFWDKIKTIRISEQYVSEALSKVWTTFFQVTYDINDG